MRWLAIAVALLTLVFAGAGCGGGSSEASTDTDVVATDTIGSEDTSADETSTDETSTDETSTDAGTDTNGSFNFASEDCQNLVKAYLGLSAAVSAASGGADVSGDVEKFSEFTKDVPDEIKGDVQTIAAAYGTYVNKLKDLGLKPGDIPNADQISQLQEASQSLGSPEVQSASTHLTAWANSHCSK